MSASGQRQIVVQNFQSGTGGAIYVSGNYGSTWTESWLSAYTGLDFVTAAASSTLWFAASATRFVYTNQAAGSISSWTTVTSYNTKDGSASFAGITQIQVSNDGQYLLVLDYTNLDIVLYLLSSGAPVQVGNAYYLVGYTTPVISNLTETGGFSVLAINGSSQPSILNYSNNPEDAPVDRAIPATGVTTPKIVISSQDSTFKIAVFNTEVENATATYLSSNYGIDWTQIPSADLADVSLLIFSAAFNIGHLVTYENGATQQALRTSTANNSYTQNSSLPYAPADPADWPTAPTTLSGAVDQLATVAFSPYPSGSYTDPVSDVTVTGPILSMGATGSAGPIILQAGLSATHVLELYTATGPNIAYSQTKTKPGSYSVNTVYGPSGPDLNNNLLTYFPQIVFNTSRGYATGPTGLQNGDPMGLVVFSQENVPHAIIGARKVGPTGSIHAALDFSVGSFFSSTEVFSMNTTGPIDQGGLPTGPVGPNIALTAHMYPTVNATYNLGATGYQFKDIHFSGSLYNNGTPFSGGGGITGLTYRATGPTGPDGSATGPRAPTLQVGAFLVPTTDATYDLGATGIQFKDVHFSGSIYNNGTPFQGGVSGLTYRATGPTGPDGSATGPTGPTLQIDAFLVPTTDATYDLGATGIQFRDVHFSGSLYNNGTPFQGGVSGLTYRATGPTGPTGGSTGPTGPTLQVDAFLVPTTDATYDLGATGIQFRDVHFSGSIYNNGTPFQGGVSGLTYRATGPTGPDGSATGPTGPTLQVGAFLVPTTDATYDLGATGIQFRDVHFSGSIYNNGTPFQGGVSGLTYRATGPTGPNGSATGPTGPTLQVGAFLVPTTDATYDLGATGIQFKDAFFSGTLYNNGVPFSGGATTGLTYRATGPTGPTGGATGPAPQATIQIGTHLVPTTDLAYDLGATGLRFRDMYVGGSTIYLGDTVRLSGSAGTFSVNSAPLVSSSTVQNTGAGGIGVTFEELTLTNTMNSNNLGTIAMSANGQYITYLAPVSGTQKILYSSDYGLLFTAVDNPTNQYKYVAVSSTGQYQASVVDASGVYFSSNYGVTWAYGGLNNVAEWGGISISTDGKILVGWNTTGGYYITPDEFPTDLTLWITSSFTNSTTDVKMSANGDRVLQLANGPSGYQIQGFKVTRSAELTSLDPTPAEAFILTSFPTFAPMISLSGDGTRIGVYGTYSSNLISNQFTWSISGSGSITQVGTNNEILPSANWSLAFPSAISSNGAIQLVAGGPNSSNGAYISFNYGVTWSAIAQSSSPNVAGTGWYFVLMSSDGIYINLFPINGQAGWAQCEATTPTLTLTNIPYTPTTSGDWPTNYIPTTVGGALNTIAKYLNSTQTMSAWTNLT
jgi:hypothetical protein